MDSRTTLKLSGAVCLLIGSTLFVYSQYASSSAAPPPPPSVEQVRAQTAGAAAPPTAQRAPREGRPDFRNMSEADRQAFRTRMQEELGLTPEQQQKLDALRQGQEGPPSPEHFRAMQEILTPQQREQMQSRMESRMRARMTEDAGVLPPAERQKLETKIEERIQEMRDRMARGEGPPFGGPGGPPRSR